MIINSERFCYNTSEYSKASTSVQKKLFSDTGKSDGLSSAFILGYLAKYLEFTETSSSKASKYTKISYLYSTGILTTVCKRMAQIITVGCALLCTTLYLIWVFQWRCILYKPTKEIISTPDEYHLKDFEDLTLLTKDNQKLNCWLIKSRNWNTAPTVLFLHGNEGNMSHRLEHVITFRQMDCNILMLSYRGYGKSSGKPSFSGLLMDAETALDYLMLREDIDTSKVVVYGHCLGAAVGIHLIGGSRHKVRSLIVENTFTSFEKLVKLKYPHTGKFTLVIPDKWQSNIYMRNVNIPCLFISGQCDRVIPPSMTQELFQLATSAPYKKFVPIPKGEHDDTYMQPGYMQHVMEFVAKSLHQDINSLRNKEMPSYNRPIC